MNLVEDHATRRSGADIRRAGFVSRGVAFVIDFGVVIVGYPLILWSIGIATGLLEFEAPTYPDLEPWASALLSTAWPIVYFTTAWVAAGRTVGQAVLGLRVVGLRRQSVGVVQAATRCVAMLVTSFPVGTLWLLMSRPRLALHDRLTRTQVLYDWSPPRAEVTVGVAVDAGGP